MELFVAFRYLRGKRKIGFISLIAYISAAGVFLGSLVLVVALSIANGFEQEVRDRIIGIFAHARVLQYYSRPIEPYDSLRQVIMTHPDVVAASPYISGQGSVEHEGFQHGVIIMGIDQALEPQVTDIATTLKAGKFEFDSVISKKGRTYPGVLVGTGLADKIGVRPGSELVVGTIIPTEDLDPMAGIRAGRFVVTGLFETGMYEYDLNLVYISLNSARELFAMPGVEGIQIKTKNLFHADKIAQKVKDFLGGYPFKATDWKNQNKSLFKWMKLERLIIFIVISLIIIVAAFNIICSLIMMILEKRSEIGVLMSMGASPGSIMRIFMFNGIIIGFLGSTLGVGLGVLLCYIQDRFNLVPLPGDIYFITSVPVLLRSIDVLFIFLSANIICYCATLYPAWLASRVLPADSMRRE